MLSLLRSTLQVIAHVLIFSGVLILLFRPAASAYLRRARPGLFVVPVVTGAGGEFALAGIAAGGGPVEFYLQGAILDPSQPQGFALSNAVKLQFLP